MVLIGTVHRNINLLSLLIEENRKFCAKFGLCRWVFG